MAGSLICAVILLTPALASAGGHSVVLLDRLQSSHPTTASVVEATRGLLIELGVDVVVAPERSATNLQQQLVEARGVARANSAMAVVWFEAEANSAVIYLFDPGKPRLMTRRVALSGSEAAAAEEVAVVLRAAVTALLEGAEAEMTEVSVPEPISTPAKAPAPPKPPAARAREIGVPQETRLLRFGLSYMGTAVGPEPNWSHAVRLSAAARAAPRVRVGAAYQLVAPLSVSGPSADTRLWRHPGELTAAYEFGSGPLLLEPELAMILDGIRRRTERTEPPLEPTAATTRWVWAVSARLGGALSLGRGCSSFFRLGVDFVLNQFEQFASVGGEPELVFSPLPVRPVVELGFWFGVM